MTVRNLDAYFRPSSVAIVGASAREGSVGQILLENVLSGGFKGSVYPINPKYDRLHELPCYASAAELPGPVDLAVIATPSATVPVVVAELAAAGCRAGVVVTAGVDAKSGLRQAMLDAARPHTFRIVGPNTIGTLSPWLRLNASFAPANPPAGGIALVSQSGAILTSIIDWAASEGIGFSQIVSLGDMSDVDVGDCLNWLATDPSTKSILLYLESVPAPRKFMSAARAAARVKPVIALKPGRHEAAAKAALTHTGALAGSDNVVEAAFRRAGVIRVRSIEELFYAAEITSRFESLPRARVAIVTNGGGAGVLALDELLDRGCELATLGPETMAELERALPPTWSHANPVDIIGDATPERYRAAIDAAARDQGVDLVLAMNCPTALASPLASASALAEMASDGRVHGKPVLACWLGHATAEPARAILRQAGVATAGTPVAAAQAAKLLTDWATLKDRIERVPESFGDRPTQRDAIHKLLRQVADEGRRLLTEPEAKTLLRAVGIESPEIITVAGAADVEAAATKLLRYHRAVVVKLFSKTLTHKSDIGGVALNLAAPAAARQAAETIARRVPPAGLDGFVVQPMIERSKAHELLIGINTDPNFGPVLVFGAGGTAVEVLRDTATGLLPLEDVLAGDLIDATRIGRLLAGYRNEAPADREAIIGVMLSLSQLVVENPAIVSLDINPLLADSRGVVALDARVEIDPSRISLAPPNPTLAVRPYPSGWGSEVRLGDRQFYIRPIRPADARLYPTLMSKMTPEDLRLRFLVPTSHLSEETITRLSQLDYDRDIAFVAIDQRDGSLAAVVRYAADPDHVNAEFGALVRSDLQGIGLGNYLMGRLIDYARADGLQTLTGLMLRENCKMIDLATRLGFTTLDAAEAGGTLRMSLQL